jgi:uroporphyrinogen-III synthase
MTTPHFQNRRVLTLESRRAAEIATLIERYGGRPVLAPALRELPLESNAAALDFGAALLLGEIDIVIFLTGAGVQALAEIGRAHV